MPQLWLKSICSLYVLENKKTVNICLHWNYVSSLWWWWAVPLGPISGGSHHFGLVSNSCWRVWFLFIYLFLEDSFLLCSAVRKWGRCLGSCIHFPLPCFVCRDTYSTALDVCEYAALNSTCSWHCGFTWRKCLCLHMYVRDFQEVLKRTVGLLTLNLWLKNKSQAS